MSPRVIGYGNHSMCLPWLHLDTVTRHLRTASVTDDCRCGCFIQIESILVYFILLNIPINYHPMNLFPALAPTSNSNIADFFTRPLPTISHHRYTQLVIGDAPTPSTSVAVDSVTVATTVVASAPTVVASATASDSVPSLHPNLTLPIVLDTGASFSISPSRSDFLPVNQAQYGLIPSAALNNSVAKALALADPYTLITGEDVSVAVDLSSSDLFALNSDSVETASSFTKAHFAVREFGTASLTFIFSPNLSLIKVFVTPTQVDWIHWIPLPRLILPESYFHIFGLDYLQAFTLFHLIPIWIALVSALLRSE